MPTYEYQCQKCGHTFEEFQSIKAEPLVKCTQKGCRGKVRRLIGAGAGLLFKGSGFYITDYRSEGYKKAAKAGDSASSGSSSGTAGSGSSGGSSESKGSSTPASPAAAS
ncbi:MAG: zinc ribbon domain-containing protein [Candidatus Latescibacteria bacterium]|nr:zinc ribbon domain-containing protein [Candidatus Latescibacterota bacterium]